METFGRLLRVYRSGCVDTERGKRSLTQERFGELIGQQLGGSGYSGAAISDWERDKSQIHKDDRRVLLSVINVLHACGGIPNLAEANKLLAAGHYGALSTAEQHQVNAAWLEERPSATADHTYTLADLPLQEIPDPGPLPIASRLPLRPNPLFVGRQAELRALAQAIQTRDTVAVGQTIVTTGLGGIGKTQLAVEFAHRYGRYFPGGVFWLNFTSPEAIAAQIASCGSLEGMALQPDFDNLPLTQQIKLVQRAWREPVNRLLIFDDCHEETLLAQWRPPTGGCRLIITSRRGRWDPALGVAQLALKVFSREESIALLHQFRPDLPPDMANAIAHELGDLPLALHLAGSFLNTYREVVSALDYLAELRTWRDQKLLDHPSLQGWGANYSPTAHELHVARTFAMSYDRLDLSQAVDRLAHALLARATCFAPNEPIPHDLLQATVSYAAPSEAEKSVLMATALQRLINLGLVTEEVVGMIRLHQLVIAFVKGVTSEQTAQADVEETLLAEAERLHKLRNPIPLRIWQPHLRYATDAAQPRQDARAAGLANELGIYLWLTGAYTEAKSYLAWALATREQVLGPQHLDTAASMNALGVLLRAMGEYGEARLYYERALVILEQTLGPEHPDTATSLSNLGNLLASMGEYARARPYLEQTLAIREKVLGKKHLNTAASLNNLGVLLEAMGEHAAARGYYEQALAIKEKVLGPEHPSIATGLSNLGVFLDDRGDHARARPYLERGLAIREKVLGPEHPDTATSLNNLGVLLEAMGEYAAARPYLERGLTIREKVLGSAHPRTASSLNNLGALLQTMGDYAGARPYLERALTIREKVSGEAHPDTAESLRNLGLLLQAIGDYKGAQLYLERAFTIHEKVLGPDHPLTAQSLAHSGHLREVMRDTNGAQAYYERVTPPREG